jgi:hypothetical protein
METSQPNRYSCDDNWTSTLPPIRDDLRSLRSMQYRPGGAPRTGKLRSRPFCVVVMLKRNPKYVRARVLYEEATINSDRISGGVSRVGHHGTAERRIRFITIQSGGSPQSDQVRAERHHEGHVRTRRSQSSKSWRTREQDHRGVRDSEPNCQPRSGKKRMCTSLTQMVQNL